jgi:hypothetical protein
VVEAFNGTGYGVLVPSYDEILHACTLQELAYTWISTVTSIISGTTDTAEWGMTNYTSDTTNCLPGLNHGTGSLQVKLLLCSRCLSGRRRSPSGRLRR